MTVPPTIMHGALQAASFPVWLQAIGSVGALAVTSWLAYLTSRYVRATDQIATTARQQVDLALNVARQNQAVVSRTLLEETSRLRTALGPKGPGGGAVSPIPSPSLIPRVHRWLHSVIPQIAQTNAAIVGEFMGLERDLRNLRAASELLDDLRTKRDQAFQLRDEMYDLYHKTENTPDDVIGWREANRGADVAEQRVREGLDAADRAYARCHETLDGLEVLLTPIADAAPL